MDPSLPSLRKKSWWDNGRILLFCAQCSLRIGHSCCRLVSNVSILRAYNIITIHSINLLTVSTITVVHGWPIYPRMNDTTDEQPPDGYVRKSIFRVRCSTSRSASVPPSSSRRSKTKQKPTQQSSTQITPPVKRKPTDRR